MLQLRTWSTLLTLFLMIGSCAGGVVDRPPGGSGSAGKTCTNYSERQVSQTYCERQAQQTCRTYCDSYGCRQSCGGGGYCESYGTRTVTINECTDFVCTAGLIRAEGGCFTADQLEARREWRVGRALRVVSKRWKVPVDSAAAYYHTATAFRYGYDGLPTDKQLSYEFAQGGCERGSSLACLILSDYVGLEGGREFINLDGTMQGYDPLLSRAYRQLACDLGGVGVCVAIAAEWLEPIPALGDQPARAADPDKARAELINYCDDGEAVACDRIASLYIGGEFKSDTPHQEALKYYQRSCSIPIPKIGLRVLSCMEAAKLMYNGAEDLERDVAGAQEIANRIHASDPERITYDTFLRCVLNGGRFCGMTAQEIDALPVEDPLAGARIDADSLVEAAVELQSRENATHNELKLAFDYLNEACELGQGEGCKILGDDLWNVEIFQDRSAAQAIWDRGCELGDGISCFLLAKVYLYQDPYKFTSSLVNGMTIKSLPGFADVDSGLATLDRGCALGNVSSCRDAGRIVLATQPRSPETSLRAHRYFLSGCENGENSLAADSCVAAALMIYSDTWGLVEDREAASNMLEDAKRFTDHSTYFFKETGITWRDKTASCILASQPACG